MRILVVTALVLALGGCASPGQFYTLTALPETAVAASPPGGGAISVALGRVELPGALDQPQMARRLGPNELTYSESDQWAGPLSGMVRGVLSADLARSLPAGMVLVAGGVPARLSVALDIQRFDADASGRVVLVTRWQAIDPDGAAIGPPQAGRIVLPGGGGGGAAIAATMSRAIALLAHGMAATLAADARLPGAPQAIR